LTKSGHSRPRGLQRLAAVHDSARRTHGRGHVDESHAKGAPRGSPQRPR
jgi:hypothetical protein